MLSVFLLFDQLVPLWTYLILIGLINYAVWNLFKV